MSSAAAFTPPAEAPVKVERVYVWDLVVRTTHWLIAFSIVVLAATGYYIGNPFIEVPGPARDHFVMGTVKVVHYYAAIVFTLAVLSRVLWMFVGSRYARWDQFIPYHAERRRDFIPTLRFYLFIDRYLPEGAGHNPLAGFTYVFVFLIYFGMIATGLAMYSAEAGAGSPMRLFMYVIPWVGGLSTARWLHHIGMWLLLGFAVHHVYSSILVSGVMQDGTIGSIINGFKFVGRRSRGKSPDGK